MAETGDRGRRYGLGRGLGALIPGGQAVRGGSGAPLRVPVDAIRANPEQPRREFSEGELESLAGSIREHGVLQPLVVVAEGNVYRLVAGERRLRAARLAGLADVPVVLRDEPGQQASLALSLIENIQRHDLSALEEAEAYRRLLDEFQLSQEDIARQVGRTRGHISNTIRLLGLAAAVQSALLTQVISAGHARALASLSHQAQEHALRRVVRDGLNVRQTEQLVQSAVDTGQPPRRQRAQAGRDPELLGLEREIRDALQTRVSLQRRRKGGRLVIEFYSDSELDRIYRHIVPKAPG